MSEKSAEIRASIINLRVLAAAVAFASKDEARYYLNGVCLEIEPRAVTYIATDGHRLIAYREEIEDAETPNNLLTGTFIIPTPHCKPHKVGKDDDPRAKIFGEGRLTIAFNFCDVTFLPIDGVFPNWRKIVPREQITGVLGQFDLKLLSAFQKFGAAVDLPPPFIGHNGPEAPALIWYPQRREVLGVIMPFKMTNELAREVPEWARGTGDHEQADIEDAA